MRRITEQQIRWTVCGRSAGTIAGLVLLPVTAFCQDAPRELGDAFHLSLGTFVVNTDTKLRLDGDAGEQGRQIDWEKNFGEGDVNRFRLDGYWRFADRHKLRALVLQLLARGVEDDRRGDRLGRRDFSGQRYG